MLIITGGDDDPVRLVTEFRIATAMLKQNKPIIGVCHGAFLLTETLGGQNGNIAEHYNTGHVVQYKQQLHQVNSYHCRYIKHAPLKAQVLCTDPVGNCEAWIDNNIAAVVWHPERMKHPWLPDEIQALLN